ncbi:hypothetical protein ACJX0J_040289, partial [Zea mays]
KGYKCVIIGMHKKAYILREELDHHVGSEVDSIKLGWKCLTNMPKHQANLIRLFGKLNSFASNIFFENHFRYTAPLISNTMKNHYMEEAHMDISLLHGLRIKFVLVPGTHIQIDKLLSER